MYIFIFYILPCNCVYFLGCLPSTISDFWQMVWQENCRVIVMTTKEMERGKNKCVRYWPEQGGTKEFGKCKVKNLIESSTPHYTLREFLVSMEGSVGERKVYHYHFQVSTFSDFHICFKIHFFFFVKCFYRFFKL